MLCRIGPVTAAQSRQLLKLATRGRDTEWRLILTDDDGRACAVERIRLGHITSASPHPDPNTGGTRNAAQDTGPGAARTDAGSGGAGTDTSLGGARPDTVHGAARTDAEPGDTGGDTTAVVGRATLTMRESWLVASGADVSGARQPDVTTAAPVPPGQGHQPGPSRAGTPLAGQSLLAPVMRAAERAVARVRAERAANAQAGGSCAHSAASPAYRPPPRLREYVAARDVTCRFPPCGQPTWRGDLDHTVPWQQGGPTCSCNLGGTCRVHHQLKQLPGWSLEQPRPGYFIWTTPAGLSYHVLPDRYPV
jgi:hypothetical protein